MNNFVKYARYYDLLYRDKDYKKETDYVDSLIKRYSRRSVKTLFDVGCGTGGHALWFAKKGYKIVGIDKSREMISIARKAALKEDRAEFKVSDVSNLSLHKKFDVAVSLFHVMSYLTTNEKFAESLKNINSQLKKGGLFIFDFWYGPAVLAQRPSKRIKDASDELAIIRRLAVPKININQDTVDVFYKNSILSKDNKLIKIVKERHSMRYFFLPELSLMLGLAGFKMVKCLKWMSFEEGVSEDSWSGVIVAKKDN